nr:MAG TPA: hypothetical protein [Bacteriophage sp.]
MGLFAVAASKRKSAISSLAALHLGIVVSDFGWVRCRVYIGPLHPTNFFNSKSPEGSGTDCPSS